MYNELEDDLPPFIVEVQGPVENYKWVGKPSINIDFPEYVPDLGIKPLNAWEKHLLKPIEREIRKIKVIITRVAGKNSGLSGVIGDIFDIPKLVNKAIDSVWERIKIILSRRNPFGAALVQPDFKDVEKELIEVKPQSIPLQSFHVAEIRPPSSEEEDGFPPTLPLTLLEIQEEMDALAEEIDVIQQRAERAVDVRPQQPELEALETETEIEPDLELEAETKPALEFVELEESVEEEGVEEESVEVAI